MTDRHEQRRSRRIHVYGEAVGTGRSPFKASVVNLSREGVCLEHAARLEPGQAYGLRFRIPPMTFAVRARVVWSAPHRQDMGSPGGPGLFRSGAEFVDISEDARGAIDTIVARPPA